MTERLGIAEARSRLGSLVARAVHAHQPTLISRSSTERAVLISEDDYEELLRLRREREAVGVRDRIAAAQRGESMMVAYDDAATLYRDLDLLGPDDLPEPGGR